ncbi:competence protein ComEA [Isoptericola sp. CG 20/1183]|uniref:Competence protein ComEA n=1 Tax=Isoptericola halotolerans TaxID=300560 RepID=A0ABX5EEP2_9MICO|nr:MULTISPECIES: ComEA family DNA-binding protein [Isoptericola]PRZ05087.1 competence protein ComEA [Isoptericola halotolerans]PRZ05825.1 competence protein ComEA [Isoptericola sp. CG 20/1183]
MTTSATPRTTDAAARLDALRAALDESVPGPPAPDRASVPGAGGGGPGVGPDPELVERLRARRSAGHVAAAYGAAHGHPVAPDDGATRRRWALSGPAAVAACAVVLVLGLTVAAVAHFSGGSTEDLGVAVEESSQGVPLRAEAPGDAATDPLAPAGPEEATDPVADPATDPATEVGTTTSPPGVVVHVTGQVADPGLVHLPAGSRVADAVEAAGGATDEADLAALNLARAVVDGEQVRVPAPGEDPPVALPGGTPDGTPGEPAADAAPVALNTAGADALTALPGVGPVIAERIVAWREENGPFTRVDELAEVSGIGPALLADVRDLVVL